jgi:hypothetical protein
MDSVRFFPHYYAVARPFTCFVRGYALLRTHQPEPGEQLDRYTTAGLSEAASMLETAVRLFNLFRYHEPATDNDTIPGWRVRSRILLERVQLVLSGQQQAETDLAEQAWSDDIRGMVQEMVDRHDRAQAAKKQ